MQCPQCNVTLLMGERLSTAIDYCPQCRGVWLAPGQLERLLSTAGPASTAPASCPPPQSGYGSHGHSTQGHGGHGHGGGHQQRGGHHGSHKNWLHKLLG